MTFLRVYLEAYLGRPATNEEVETEYRLVSKFTLVRLIFFCDFFLIFFLTHTQLVHMFFVIAAIVQSDLPWSEKYNFIGVGLKRYERFVETKDNFMAL